MNNFFRTAVASLLCTTFQVWTTAAAAAPLAPDSNQQKNSDVAVAHASDTKPENKSSSVLPFFGDEARARGYDLPEPFGINLNYMNIRQDIHVGSINFSGLALGSIPLNDAFKINAGHTRERSKTETAKFDTWLFPFMDVYALVGHTKGHSVSNIGVGTALFGGKTTYPPSLQDLKFQLDFKGTTYGAGATFVGGMGNWFTSLDTNYTQTHFDILDGTINAFTLSPRVGYRFTTPEISSLSLPSGKLNLWVGSMYQDVQQTFKGSLSDLHMPSSTLQNLVNMANRSGDGRFKVKQHLQSPWNVLVGSQYELTRNFNVITEWGFAQRNSFFVSGEYRF